MNKKVINLRLILSPFLNKAEISFCVIPKNFEYFTNPPGGIWNSYKESDQVIIQHVLYYSNQ